MHVRTIYRLLRRRVSRLARDQRGVAAVEFAMVLPVMLTLYLGGMDVSQGVAIDRKVSIVSRSVADLAARTTTILDADMTDILSAAKAVIAPYDTSKLKITVSSVSIDAQGGAKVVWSDASNTTARARGSQVTLPAALAVPSTTVIWGEAQYAYSPMVGYVITNTINLSDQIYMRPRLVTCVTRNVSGTAYC